MSEEPQSEEPQNKEPQSAQLQKEPSKKPVAAGNKSAKVRLNKQKVQLQSLDKDHQPSQETEQPI